MRTLLQSVTGPVDPAELQWIHAHEHLVTNYHQHQGQALDYLSGNLEYGRRRLIEMLSELRRHGVNGLADPLPIGIGRDGVYARLAREVSQATGVFIFLATGVYTPEVWPNWAKEASVLELADVFTRDLEQGIEDTGIRPCMLKATVTGDVLSREEEKALTAVAIAYRRTGVHVHCHCGANRRPLVEMLTALGVDATRIYVAHADMFTSEEEWLWLAERGCRFVTTNWDFPRHMDHDEAVGLVKLLLARGYLDRLLIGLDFALESIDPWRFATWIWDNPDRTSYSYLHTHILPKLRAAGLTDEHLDWIMRRNPIAMLQVGAGGP